MKRPAPAVRKLTRAELEMMNETDKIIEAARCFFERRLSQSEIAVRMRVVQSTVSRWLQRAEEERFVESHIRVPTLAALQSELRTRLPAEIREVRVVHSGPGKNPENIGDEAAKLLGAAILDVQRRKKLGKSDTIRIVFSCGDTVRRACQSLATFLVKNIAQLECNLELYPAAVFMNAEIQTYHPATLVTMLWMQLHERFDTRVKAFAPMLPSNYAEALRGGRTSSRERARVIKESGVEKVVVDASAADIFCIGIGTVEDTTYRDIIGSLHVPEDSINKLPKEAAELVYVPLRDELGIGERVVGVKHETLEAAAADPARWVIGIGGGYKYEAVRQVLQREKPLINCLVTDKHVAEKLLDQAARTPLRGL